MLLSERIWAPLSQDTVTSRWTLKGTASFCLFLKARMTDLITNLIHLNLAFKDHVPSHILHKEL